MKNDKEVCLEIEDYQGSRVVFYEKTRLKKAKKRPELRSTDFLKGQLTQAVKNPWRIYKDFNKTKERRCYYYKEYSTKIKTKYTKVVIDISENPYIIITAYRPDYIKEEKLNSKSEKIYDSKKN